MWFLKSINSHAVAYFGTVKLNSSNSKENVQGMFNAVPHENMTSSWTVLHSNAKMYEKIGYKKKKKKLI